jgi:hypothetical protein
MLTDSQWDFIDGTESNDDASPFDLSARAKLFEGDRLPFDSNSSHDELHPTPRLYRILKDVPDVSIIRDSEVYYPQNQMSTYLDATENTLHTQPNVFSMADVAGNDYDFPVSHAPTFDRCTTPQPGSFPWPTYVHIPNYERCSTPEPEEAPIRFLPSNNGRPTALSSPTLSGARERVLVLDPSPNNLARNSQGRDARADRRRRSDSTFLRQYTPVKHSPLNPQENRPSNKRMDRTRPKPKNAKLPGNYRRTLQPQKPRQRRLVLFSLCDSAKANAPLVCSKCDKHAGNHPESERSHCLHCRRDTLRKRLLAYRLRPFNNNIESLSQVDDGVLDNEDMEELFSYIADDFDDDDALQQYLAEYDDGIEEGSLLF